MGSWNPQANELFLEARERSAGFERAAFLDGACAGDSELRAQVVALLEASARAGEFLSSPAQELWPPTVDDSPLERVGSVIGPFKLLKEIGAGGMGAVFLAEQSHPVRRLAALKVIKPGMDSRQVAARFEAERQALALMDHPNIARVIDAGTTDSGRPYFVMELVKGAAITAYCDERRLTARERLELFLPVCRAVQHAHQKGVVHRDLKPSNVLVAQYDGQPVPKVIDFGVAKAIGGRLTERTMFTELGALIGTLEYMSPEQAQLNSLDVDTRSDVYSLGVLLYELLAGETPFARGRLRQAAFDEMLRIIREEEPPKPSTRLSSSDQQTTIAANRRTDPVRLSKELRGDLDWVVMKALEKDRNRRYETADGLAADVERYLREEPVEARPPSAGYRLRKFARRNRTALAVSSILLLAAVAAVGGVASAVGWAVRDRAAREQQLAQDKEQRQARLTGQLEVILQEVARLEQSEKWAEALAAARRAEPALAAGEANPDVQARMQQTIADLSLVARLEEIRAQSGVAWGTAHAGLAPLAAKADQDYAAAFRQAGLDFDALSAEDVAQLLAARSAVSAAVLPAIDDWIVVRSRSQDEASARRLADVLRAADPDPWRQKLRDVLARQDWEAFALLADDPEVDRQPAGTLSFLGAAVRQYSDVMLALRRAGKLKPGTPNTWHPMEVEVYRRAQRKYPDDFWLNHRLGLALVYSIKDAPEGIGYLRAALAVRPQSAHIIHNMGTAYAALKRYDEAIENFEQAIAISPDYGICHTCLGIALRRTGRFDQSLAALTEAARVQPDRPDLIAQAHAEAVLLLSNCSDETLRDPQRATELAETATRLDPQTRKNWTALAIARYRQGRWADCRQALDRALTLGVDGLAGFARWEEAVDWYFAAMCAWQQGDVTEARRWYDKADTATKTSRKLNEDLNAIRAEADELLKFTPAAEPQPSNSAPAR